MYFMLKNYSLPQGFFFRRETTAVVAKHKAKTLSQSHVTVTQPWPYVGQWLWGGGGGEGGKEVQVNLKLPVYIKLQFILDQINEVPHYRCGTSASQICRRVAPGHFCFYYSFMLYFQFQRELYVPRVSYGIPRLYCYCLVSNTCQPVI